MILTCWLGVHQWRIDHYSDLFRGRMVLIERVSCARCGIVRSKGVV